MFEKLIMLLQEKCILCGYPAENTLSLCKPCQKDLPILPQACIQCARFLAFSPWPVCGSCLRDPPAFHRSFALFPYEFPVKQWISRLKFNHQLFYANVLGQLMAEKIKASWYHGSPLPDLIIPIPLHTARLRERGFNQAVEIAKPIAKRLKLPLDCHGIKRIRATLAQSSLPADQRKQNIAQAFSLSRHYRYLHLALIDDVVTTGCTVNECAKLLKKNGAARVDIWCCARNG